MSAKEDKRRNKNNGRCHQVFWPAYELRKELHELKKRVNNDQGIEMSPVFLNSVRYFCGEHALYFLNCR